ncbi:MAG: ferredoxin [Deltaproteobacteria bacterium]|nr:ferredoxin [Deltaproteobacteria bacterium]
MADPNDKVAGNAQGKWYIDTQCIDCDLCRTTAPSVFKQNADEGFSYVYAQPKTEEDEKLCQDAKEECPVEAIGDDG